MHQPSPLITCFILKFRGGSDDFKQTNKKYARIDPTLANCKRIRSTEKVWQPDHGFLISILCVKGLISNCLFEIMKSYCKVNLNNEMIILIVITIIDNCRQFPGNLKIHFQKDY